MDYREIKVNDSKTYLELMLTLDNESRFMMYEPGERETNETEMAKRIESISNDGSLLYGAFDGAQVVGFVNVMRGGPNRIKHSGYVVIGVMKAYSGKGIATSLLKHADDWAIDNDILKLELTVMMHNERAHDLYLRCGYEDEGVKRKSVYVDGIYYDEYYMGKILNGEV